MHRLEAGLKVKENKFMNIIESIGKTPLVELQKVTEGMMPDFFEV